MWRSSRRKYLVVILLAALLIGAGIFFVLRARPSIPEPASSAEPQERALGTSVEGRTLNAYTYGSGATHLVFVGGIHGGYEWNSVLLAYQAMDYLDARPDAIPPGLQVTVIPSANPDGVYEVIGTEGRFTRADAPTAEDTTGKGRFNAHDVDLNRNFDCKWKPTGVWRSKTVSAGSAPFSEPEATALRDYFLNEKPAAVIFWHSKANAVYASECEKGILPQTLDIMNTYAGASGYGAVESFGAYPVTGDAEGWLASINIPAITVELSTHTGVEWEKNLRGITALFDHYTRPTQEAP